MKKILLILSIIGFPTTLLAQNEQTDSLPKKWHEPDFLKVQFAGNIGFMSAGRGYSHWNKHVDTDFMVGYLPKHFGGDDLFSLTLKGTYHPYLVPLRNGFTLTPFSTGLYFSYTFGHQFNTSWPSHYPKGYYWWASSLRLGGFIGGNIQKSLHHKKWKSVSLYYELGTYDLLLLSYIQNTDYLNLGKIVNLAFGVKVGL